MAQPARRLHRLWSLAGVMNCPLCGGLLVGYYCSRCKRLGFRIDNFVGVEVGVPVDVGWGFLVLNADETATRTCKGCGVSVTSRVVAGEVERVAFTHADGCVVFKRLGNNAA